MSGCTGVQTLRAFFALRSAGSVCSRAPLVQHRCYSSQLAQKDEGAPVAENPWKKLRTSTLKTGLIISSVEDSNCPVSKISVAVKAGSRYETPETSGITHCLRIGAELSNTGTSSFMLAKTLGQLGASLTVSSSRDHMVYTVRCLREHVEEALGLVANIVAGPAFHLWEMSALKPRLLFEAAMLADNPTAQLFEMLHDVAYRGTSVGRSLYCPQDLAGRHTPDMLVDYVLDHYKIGSMAVSGVSVPHEMLGELAQLSLAEVAQGKGPAPPAAKYGGGEARKHVAGSQVARVALAVEGAGVNDAKHSIALALLQQHIGDGPRTNFSMPTNRMSESVAKVAKSPATVTGVNIAHSDTGLFGRDLHRRLARHGRGGARHDGATKGDCPTRADRHAGKGGQGAGEVPGAGRAGDLRGGARLPDPGGPGARGSPAGGRPTAGDRRALCGRPQQHRQEGPRWQDVTRGRRQPPGHPLPRQARLILQPVDMKEWTTVKSGPLFIAGRPVRIPEV